MAEVKKNLVVAQRERRYEDGKNPCMNINPNVFLAQGTNYRGLIDSSGAYKWIFILWTALCVEEVWFTKLPQYVRVLRLPHLNSSQTATERNKNAFRTYIQAWAPIFKGCFPVLLHHQPFWLPPSPDSSLVVELWLCPTSCLHMVESNTSNEATGKRLTRAEEGINKNINKTSTENHILTAGNDINNWGVAEGDPLCILISTWCYKSQIYFHLNLLLNPTWSDFCCPLHIFPLLLKQS